MHVVPPKEEENVVGLHGDEQWSSVLRQAVNRPNAVNILFNATKGYREVKQASLLDTCSRDHPHILYTLCVWHLSSYWQLVSVE